MKIDVIIAEIGSTTTILNAFNNIGSNHPAFIGQGVADTTVLAGDVNIGINNALLDLKTNLNVKTIEYDELFASSSAAGGLKMSVHGLVYDMTVKAAKEAALGAGANIIYLTGGKLNKFDLEKIKQKNLNIIMIAGGVDYGEKETARENAYNIAAMKLNIPIIYSGNIVNHDAVKTIFKDFNQEKYLYITSNVYPRIDVLNVDEARCIIQKVFEEHITKAPGMERIRSFVNGPIMPTPGAVMEATILLSEILGNTLTVDIGGATTDIHSVADDSAEIAKYLINPEPKCKRTVEGDLGLYINKDNVIKSIGKENLIKKLNIDINTLDDLIAVYPSIPSPKHIPLTEELTSYCLDTAILRHAGRITEVFSSHGKTKMAIGKDLTNIDYIIATGGALTKLPNRFKMIQDMLARIDVNSLKPKQSTKILIDNNYIMASLGVLSKKHKEAAIMLLKNSLAYEV
ncbi:MAG: GlmL-related ornithine degradation protein [Bacilli bacterium]|nr:GlmL-related ornithine degradation protein [Bacilli bacterium]